MDKLQLNRQASSFIQLRRFSDFLLEHYFNELVKEDLKRAKAAKIPLLKFFSDYEEGEFFEFAQRNMRVFLEIFSSEAPYAKTAQLLKAWKENKISDFPKKLFASADLINGFTTRKQTLLSFIPFYTRQVEEAVAIAQELEQYYAFLESESFNIFLESQKENEKEMHRAMEIARIGSYTWDIINDQVSFTAQLYKIFGIDEQTKINFDTILAVIHPDYRKPFKQAIEESIRHRWPLDVEYRILRKNNDERIVWGKGETIYQDGKAVLMQGTVLDVTERRLTEIEVQYREAQLVEAQAIAQIGSFDWDFLQNHSSCTAELYRIFGWPHERELNFKTFEELSHPEDLEKLFLALHNAMNNKAPFDCEYRIIRPDGSQKWVWAKGKVSFDQNGNTIRLTGTVLDISERKQAEEELNAKNNAIIAAYKKLEQTQEELKEINHQLEDRVKERTRDLELSMMQQKESAAELLTKNEQLEKINADLDNFIYTASHDLKAPITNIEGLVNILKGVVDTENPKFDQIIGMINSSIWRFKETIKDLTEISKVQKDIREDVELLNLEKTLQDALFDIQELMNKNTASVNSDFQVKELRFSRKNLRSLLYNLVSNAIKYHSPDRKPQILVSSRKENEFIVISIKDNGLGIPKNKTEKIFSMFRRLHSHVDGTGVGLYIVKRIIDNASGHIKVESEVGLGSTFHLYLKDESPI